MLNEIVDTLEEAIEHNTSIGSLKAVSRLSEEMEHHMNVGLEELEHHIAVVLQEIKHHIDIGSKEIEHLMDVRLEEIEHKSKLGCLFMSPFLPLVPLLNSPLFPLGLEQLSTFSW